MIEEHKLLELVDSHEKQLQKLHNHREEDRLRIEMHDDQIAKLDSTISDLKERFGNVSTHKDIQELHEKIDSSINGLLKDALAAVPGKISLIFTGIIALVAIISLVANLHPHMG